MFSSHTRSLSVSRRSTVPISSALDGTAGDAEAANDPTDCGSPQAPGRGKSELVRPCFARLRTVAMPACCDKREAGRKQTAPRRSPA